MFFINELDDIKLYKKEFLLPLNEKDKRKNGISILMGTDYESSCNMMNYSLMNPKYYNSYYTERAVLYYVNQEGSTTSVISDCIITETLEDIISNENNQLIVNGLSNDVSNTVKYLNHNTIEYLSKDYKFKLNHAVHAEVLSSVRGKKENDKNHIYLMSENNYNKALNSYEQYVYYNIMEMILCNVNPKLNRNYRYAIALYDSGLYNSHKDDWIFGDHLYTLTYAVDLYVRSHGHKKMARTIPYHPEKLFFSNGKTPLPDALSNDIKRMFNVSSVSDLFENTQNNLNSDENLLQIDNNIFLSSIVNEDSSYNSILRRNLYDDRFKTLKDVKDHYEMIKKEVPYINKTFNTLDMYNNQNLFLDGSHYNKSFISNNTIKKDRGANIYFELMLRIINDKRFNEGKNKYNLKSVLIPVYDWIKDKDSKGWMINVDINPISCLFNAAKANAPKMKQLFGNTTFIFLGKDRYFKLNFSTIDLNNSAALLAKGIKRILMNDNVDEDDNLKSSSPKAITVDVIDKIEKSQGVKIDDISTKPDSDESTIPKDDKKELVKTVKAAAEKNSDIEDTMDELDNDELKSIIANLSANAEDKSNISDARASRMIRLQNDILDKQFKDKSIRDLTNVNYDEKPLESVSLPVDSINEEWNDLKYITQEELYDMDSDIVQIFNSFSTMTHPLAVREITAEDASTSEDAVATYKVSYETDNGKRFSIKLDIPIWINNKYLLLRGNKKDLPNQLFLMPIIKTDIDTVQIVTNYNKIFIRRFGTTTGKSLPSCDKLIKTLSKNEFKNLKIELGDCSKICNRYELPIDYIDLASVYKKITTPSYTIYFNQENLYEEFGDKIDLSKGIPYGVYNNATKDILYYNSIPFKKTDKDFWSFSYNLVLLIGSDLGHDFIKAYDSAPRSIRYTYSRASILSADIPLILLCTYSEGLSKTLKKANINYRIESSKRNMDSEFEDFIKFNDAVIIYNLDYASSLLMNGLKACNTEDYSIAEIDGKSMYLDFLDNYGGRIKADGLDNFYNLLIDKPITYNALKYYNLPTDYIDVLLYANRLLIDNKFTKHSSYTNNRRIRRQEQIPAILYGVLARAYGKYCTDMKHGRTSVMTVKQSAVIDEVLTNSTTTDKSIINALCEYEAYAAVTPKGPSGMNSDRSYTLDKRGYDESMLNVVGMSTAFAGTVGISRQATIDANISSVRGYIKDNDGKLDKLSATKSLCMTEALTPFGCTRDDPFRTAMTYIQTSKHGMRCKRSNPSLISSGADEALPYMISDIFAFKAKQPGIVREINEDRMIVEYNDESYDYIDLSNNIEKNSSSGFYVNLKLDTDLKEGKKFKQGEVIAYDKSSFSNDIGATDNIAYNIGTFCKFAITLTDEAIEDSAIISQDLSDAMTSDVVLLKSISLPAETNVYNMVSAGDPIEEGDPLMTIQNTFDEEDMNILLRNLSADEEEITNLGRISISSKVTGRVEGIKIYRTSELEDLSPTLKKIVSKYEKSINDKKKELKKYGIRESSVNLGPVGKLPQTGKMKSIDNGVLIELYLTYEDKMSVGDKLIYYSANKGVVKDIFPKGDEPRSSYRPNEKIHALTSVIGVNGRMVCSIQTCGGINKGLVELSRHVKDILGIKYNDNLFED